MYTKYTALDGVVIMKWKDKDTKKRTNEQKFTDDQKLTETNSTQDNK